MTALGNLFLLPSSVVVRAGEDWEKRLAASATPGGAFARTAARRSGPSARRARLQTAVLSLVRPLSAAITKSDIFAVSRRGLTSHAHFEEGASQLALA